MAEAPRLSGPGQADTSSETSPIEVGKSARFADNSDDDTAPQQVERRSARFADDSDDNTAPKQVRLSARFADDSDDLPRPNMSVFGTPKAVALNDKHTSQNTQSAENIASSRRESTQLPTTPLPQQDTFEYDASLRQRTLRVGDLVAFHCNRGFLASCAVGHDRIAGKFGDMNVCVQPWAALASTTSSGAAALGTSRVFEIYRATSAEDLYRASMMQQQQAADNGGGSGGGGITSTPGTPVLFNQVVQLRHFRSKKLLVLDIRSKAKHDSLSMEVVLQSEHPHHEATASSRGNSGAASVGGMDVEMLNNSWFSLESANGFLDLGEVHLGDDFHFVSNRWNRFLHVAEPRHSFPDDDKEEMGSGGGGGRDGPKGSAKSSSVVAVGYRSSGSSDEDEEVEDGKGGETCLDEDADRVLGEEVIDSAFAEERAPQAIGRARSSTRLFRQGNEAQERYRQQERETRKQRRRVRASWPRVAGSFSRTTFHCVPYRLFEKTLALSSSSDAGMPVGGDTSGLDGDDSAEGSAAVCGGDVLYLSHTVDGALRYWRDPTLKDRPSLCCLKPSLSGEEGSGSSTAEASFQHASMEASLLDMWEVSN